MGLQSILLALKLFFTKGLKRHFNVFILLTFAATALTILVLSVILADITYKGTRLFFGELPDLIRTSEFKELAGEIRVPSILYEEHFREEILDKLKSKEDEEKLLSFYSVGSEEYLGGVFTRSIYRLDIIKAGDKELKSILSSISYNMELEKLLLRSYIYIEGEGYVFRDYLIDLILSYGSFSSSLSYELNDSKLALAYDKFLLGKAIDYSSLSISARDFNILALYINAYKKLPVDSRGKLSDEDIDIIRRGFSLVEFKHTPLAKFVATNPLSGMKKGGIFPAIFGTIALVIIMSIAVIPIGVITALYLGEYAGNNRITRLIRLAIHNLASVPAIVFGLFGLGFFIQFMGTGIDSLFYGGELVYGQPAIIWSALVLALLTLPVVIVSTEEALRAIPVEIRHASYALGATKLQTILKLVIPNSMTGILTGAILSVSRGVGEVAPILFTGAAYFLEELPVGLNYQFMELGYHIYILATQSPNVEEVKPVLYSTVFVLLILTFFLNLIAILARLRMRRKFKGF